VKHRPRKPEGQSNDDSFAIAAVDLAGWRNIRNPPLRDVALKLKTAPSEETERELRRYIAEHGRDADALRLLAILIVPSGRRREAQALLVRCLELAPDFAAARFEHAKLLLQMNRFQDALREIELVLAGDAGNPLFLQVKAAILEQLGENEQAVAACEALATANPGRVDCWVRYAQALRAAGRQEESVAAYRRAIAVRPSLGTAYWGIADMKSQPFSDKDVREMEQQLKRPDIAADDRVMLQFALGKSYEDRRSFSRAWEQYAKANASLRLRVSYDPQTLVGAVAKNKQVFTSEFFRQRSGMGCSARDPIFVVGRQRSGSTLIEQILASHSAVEGTGELPYIPALAERLGNRDGGPAFSGEYLEALASFGAEELRALGKEYLQDARVHRKFCRPFFIDKKPGNFLHTGMIQLILPNAKIIDARRHPAASAVSMFKHFSNSRLRLSELGSFYRGYVELMAHFDRVLPGRVHRVMYEELVRHPEREVRRLLDYLELPFEETCLRFYETKRAVLTPSAEQVRQPLSDTAVDFWRNYDAWLRPLLDSLGSAATDYPDVPPELR